MHRVIRSRIIIALVVLLGVVFSYIFEHVVAESAFWQPEPIISLGQSSEQSVLDGLSGYLTATVKQYPIYEDGIALRVGDLNHDGLNDVSFVTESDRLQIWFQNPGCHEIQKGLDIVTVPEPQDLAIGDLNGDARADIVLIGTGRQPNINSLPGVLHILLQSENGFTTIPITYTVGVLPRRVRIADVTSDGKQDIVVSSNNNLDVLVQQPGGAFSATVVADPVIQSPYDLAIADFNNDGHNDIALQGINQNPNVVIYLQKIDGSGFESGYFLEKNSDIFGGYGMAAGDITGDGLVDIITVLSKNTPDATIVIYTQLSTGGFSSPDYMPTYQVPVNPVLFDMNLDGRLDVIVLNSGYFAYTVHYQQADGSLGPAVTTWIDEVQSPFTRYNDVGDVTGDGQPDLVYLNTNTGLNLVTNNPMSVCPSAPPPVPAIAPGFLYGRISRENCHEIVAGDVDGDGLQDFLALEHAPAGGTLITIVKQYPDGTFGLYSEVKFEQVGPFSSARPQGLSIGDLDADNRLDAAIAYPYSDGSAAITLQQADGSFSPALKVLEVSTPAQTYIADWTGDGLDDLAVIAAEGLYILAQQPNGTLGNPVLLAAGQIGVSLNNSIPSTIGDWNGDGRMDLIAWWDDRSHLPSRSTTVRVFLQKADGAFQMLTGSFLPTPTDLQIGDVNSDGRPDVILSVSGNYPHGVLGIIPQQADGSLGNRILLSAPYYERPGGLAIADLNNDHLNDLLVMNSWKYFSVFTQNQTNTFDPVLLYSLPTINNFSAHRVAQIDDDHDGAPEAFGIASPDDYLVFLKPFLPNNIYLPLVER